MARFNTNVHAKSHERVKLDGFRGVDTSSASVDVETFRATEMRNMISRNGLNHKRHGWEQQLLNTGDSTHPNNFGGPVRGIYGFKFAGEKETRIIVYANCKFWEKIGNGNFSEISCESTNLEDRSCQFYLVGDELYVLGMGDFLKYQKGKLYSPSEFIEVSKVAYTPTTVINIAPQEYSDNTEYNIDGVAYEPINLLSDKRKAKLIAMPLIENDAQYYFEYEITISAGSTVDVVYDTGTDSEWEAPDLNNLPSDITASIEGYTLSITNNRAVDCTLKLRQSKTISDKAKTATYILEDGASFNFLKGQEITSSNGILWGPDENTIYGWAENNIVAFAKSPSYDTKGEISIIPNSTAFAITLKATGAKIKNITCTNHNTPIDVELTYSKYDEVLIEGEVDSWVETGLYISYELERADAELTDGTLEVEYTKPIEGYKERITKCKISQLFGVNGHSDRLFVAGSNAKLEDWKGNHIVQWSEIDNFTYFPDVNYTRLGTQITAINGMQRLNDDSLCIFKEPSVAEPTIYVMYGEYTTDSEGNTKDIFRTYAGNVAEGLIAPNSTGNLAGDILMLSPNGVFGIEMSENVVSTSKYTKERSLPIKRLLKEFTREQLKQACSIVRDDRYLLCVGDKCFVAESRYSYKPKGSPRDTFSYEWYVWDNIPALCFAEIDTELYFGTQDGRLCKFTNGFVDKKIDDFGSMTVKLKNDTITVSGDLKSGDMLKISNALYGKVATGAATSNKTIRFDEDKFYITNEKGEKIPKFITEKYVRCIDVSDRSVKGFNIVNVDTVNLTIDLVSGYDLVENHKYEVYYSLENEYLTVDNPDINTEEEGKQATVKIFNVPITGFHISPSPEVWEGYKVIIDNVVAEWFSAIMDFGTPDYSKTLLGFTVAPERIEGDNMEFGYITRELDSEEDVKMLRKNISEVTESPLNLGNLSMFFLSFNTFQTSFTKKVKVRNFNYLMWFVKSDSPTDSAVNSIIFDYKVNRKNKGVN